MPDYPLTTTTLGAAEQMAAVAASQTDPNVRHAFAVLAGAIGNLAKAVQQIEEFGDACRVARHGAPAAEHRAKAGSLRRKRRSASDR